jgi:CRISPR-associated protein Csb2
MPTVKLRFPGGRYHATPWGHHVNEGLIEWPPSPWRLLRAFIACGFSSQGWGEVPPVARRLIDKLAAVLPLYRLPAASAAHSRHFMPVGVLAKGREQTTLVFDTWANVGAGELVIHWPCELDVEESELLGTLTSSLGYLGRSESWVEAQTTDENPAEWNAVPCVENEHRGPEWEQVSLMAAISPRDYEHWRETQVQESLRTFSGQKQTAIVKRRQAQAVEPYPADLLSSLTKDTAWWKGRGWSQPPGSQRVLYWRHNDALQVGVPMTARPAPGSTVTTMLLAITTASGNRSALPPSTRTLPQAELFHRAVVGCAADGRRIPCPELTGRDEHGRPLQHGHTHAHIWPVDLDADGHLDHIVVHAPMGLGETAQHAIRTLRRTWTKGSADYLQVAVVGSGSINDLRRLPFGQRIEQLLGPSQGARVWVSATPFVPSRFLKARGANSLLGQVNAELASRKLPPALRVEVLPSLTVALRHFVRRRTNRGTQPPVDAGYALRLHLREAISGPLAIGYGSHFGLGTFCAASADSFSQIPGFNVTQ